MTPYHDRDRSWSQLSAYEQCPQAFFLERIEKVWKRPAAWFATGQGVHQAVEAWEKGEVLDFDGMLRVAQEAYADEINARLADTPDASVWAASGPYRGPEDIIRRYNDLGRHLDNYFRVAQTLGDTWMPEADPFKFAVEYPIDLDLDGIRVIGSIDQVRHKFETEDDDQPDLEIWDVKAGSMTPDEPGQLAVYAEAIRRETGWPVKAGGYIMTAKKPTATGRVSKAQVVRKDLTTIPVETLTARFHAADEGIKAERWDPKPGVACTRCSVLTSCPAGQKHLREE